MIVRGYRDGGYLVAPVARNTTARNALWLLLVARLGRVPCSCWPLPKRAGGCRIVQDKRRPRAWV